MNAVAKCSILAWTLSAACACGAGLLPYGLECEARQNPVGIDVPKPRLGWKLRSDQQNQTQGAYHVAVATSPERLASGTPDAWDSGRVASEQQSWIEYRGAPLRSFQRYWWKVRVWDGAGTDAGWSQPAEWTTALVDPGLRRGSWIASPNTSLRSGPLPVFRKEFTVEKPVRQAMAMVSGAGFHELHVNGAKVGDRVLAPAWTNFRSTVLYETFDVSPLLKTGRNALGIMLGNGFYNVAGGRYAKYTGSFGQPRLWMQLHLEYADGTSADIATDSNWKVHDGPLTFSCIYGGEDYDARLELPGWDKPGFDDSAWPRPEGMEAPGGVLRSQSSPPVRVQRTFHPVKTTQPKPGVYVYDLGQNFSGWPKITVAGPAGAQVRLTPGELLDANGLVTQHSSGGPVYFSYVLKGSRAETWSPRFSYYGFRYVQVEGAAPAAETAKGAPVMQELEGQFVHLDAPPAGQFTCSNELLNRIHTLIDVAVRSNLQHVLTDCPHREKLGWLEQTYLMGPSLLYDWDLRTMLPKMVRDMREAQTVDGLVPDIAPEYVTFGGGFRDSPEWGSAGVLVPWLAWQWYGDWRGLEEAYPMMKRYAGYLESQAKVRAADLRPRRLVRHRAEAAGLFAVDSARRHRHGDLVAGPAGARTGGSPARAGFRRRGVSHPGSRNARYLSEGVLPRRRADLCDRKPDVAGHSPGSRDGARGLPPRPCGAPGRGHPQPRQSHERRRHRLHVRALCASRRRPQRRDLRHGHPAQASQLCRATRRRRHIAD